MIGSQLAHYRITAALGAGGMGEVWRATDEKLGREVALKVLPADFADDPARLARFEREAKVLASLNHPNIAHLYGLENAAVTSGEGRENSEFGIRNSELAATEVTFLVMELVEGEDLSERIARGAIPIDETIPIALQIAEALEAAHEAGIVHRDLKPANIKLTENGVIKVLDFGLAKAWESEGTDSNLSMSPTVTRHATMEGVILGTAGYMSPEQARGKKVDRRADIWSFGVVLWEMLTGRILFEGDTVTDVLAAVVRQEIGLHSLRAETPPKVRDLVGRCLDRDSRTRLRDIGEARIALAANPREETPAEAGSKLMSRRTFAAASAMTGAGFLLGIGLGRRLTDPGAPTADQVTLEITRLTGSSNVTSAAVSPDGRFIAYVQIEQGLQSLWLRQMASGQTLRLIPDDEIFFWGHTFSPDGNDVYFSLKTPVDSAGGIYSISALGGPRRRLVDAVDSAPAFSRDGRQISYLRQGYPSADESALMVADADGSGAKALAVFKRPEAVAPNFYSAPTWSPAGSHIVTAVAHRGGPTSDARAWLASVSTADGTISVLSDPGWVQAAQSSFLPDGRGLVVIARTSEQETTQVWYVDAVSGVVSPVTNDLNDHRVLSLTDDGGSLVSITGDHTSGVWVGPCDGSDMPRRRTWARTDGMRGVCFAADGRIIYTTNDRGFWELWSMTPDGSERTPLVAAEPGETISTVATAGSGDIYFLVRAVSGMEIRMTGADGAAPRVVATDVGYDAIGVSRDGVLVFGAHIDGVYRVLRLDHNGAAPVPITSLGAFAPTIDPSGGRIAFFYQDEAEGYRVGVVSAEDGRLIWSSEVAAPTIFSTLCLRQRGLYLTTVTGDRANLWRMSFDEKKPERLTAFDDQRLWQFAVSEDEKTFAVARGRRDRDAVLIKNFRGASKDGTA